MRPLCYALPLMLLVWPSVAASAQAGSATASENLAAGVSTAESAAIRAIALDYIEGWYAGDADRMERALHPDLAKRIVLVDGKTGASRVDHMGAMSLVQGTRKAWGTQTPEDRREKDVTILDVFGNAASVKVVAADWIDYLHMGKLDGRWVIVNVLWEMKPDRG